MVPRSLSYRQYCTRYSDTGIVSRLSDEDARRVCTMVVSDLESTELKVLREQAPAEYYSSHTHEKRVTSCGQLLLCKAIPKMGQHFGSDWKRSTEKTCGAYRGPGANQLVSYKVREHLAVTSKGISNVQSVFKGIETDDTTWEYLSGLGTEFSRDSLCKVTTIMDDKVASEWITNESDWKIVDRTRNRRNRKAVIARGNG